MEIRYNTLKDRTHLLDMVNVKALNIDIRQDHQVSPGTVEVILGRTKRVVNFLEDHAPLNLALIRAGRGLCAGGSA